MTYYVHSIPGRLRVKIPSLKGHAEKAISIQNLLKAIDGVESIRANTITGSVVVKYEAVSTSDDEILSVLEENGCFDETRAFSMDHAVSDVSSKAGKAISKAFCGWAVGRALEGTGFSFIAALI